MKKQFLALVMALLVCVGYSGVMVPATAYAAESIGYVDLNTVFAITLILLLPEQP